MTRRVVGLDMHVAYDDDDDWIENDGDDDDAEVLECPSCGARVHEETQRCPYCGDWIVPAYPRRRARRALWIIAACLVIAALIMTTVC